MSKANFVCPECGGKAKIEIPVGVCVAFKVCKACGKRILAKKDSCCIICSYSDKKCPVHVAESLHGRNISKTHQRFAVRDGT